MDQIRIHDPGPDPEFRKWHLLEKMRLEQEQQEFMRRYYRRQLDLSERQMLLAIEGNRHDGPGRRR